MYAECHENGYATAVSMGGRAARLFDFQWLARSDAGSLVLRVMFSGPREKKPPVFTTTNFVHIPFEEAKMRRQFGAAYDGYVARVGRWL